MPKLTADERTQARLFRDTAQAQLTALNRTSPTDYHPPNFLAILRHPCPKRQNRSTALQLHEVYVHSLDAISPQDKEDMHDESVPEVATTGWPGGTDRFGFIYREGVCKLCKQTARSPAGRLVDAHDRPPTSGVVARSRD